MHCSLVVGCTSPVQLRTRWQASGAPEAVTAAHLRTGYSGAGMDAPAVVATGLRKSYGEREVVAGVDLEVRTGEVLAFLGPNGAGKTTTVEILEGYRSRSAGEVSVLGIDPAKPHAGLALPGSGSCSSPRGRTRS